MAGLVEQFGPCHDGGAGHELLQHVVQYAYIEDPKTAQIILNHPKSLMA
jgi:hypothetical protein